MIAFVTSRYTMDKQSPEVRRYIAQRAELLGAIRLPNNAFRANAGTDVVSDIIFLQRREHPIEIDEDWIHLGQSENGFAINSYFAEHPEMVLGTPSSESTQYGKQDYTVNPIEGADLGTLLHEAVQNIGGKYQEAELPDLGENEKIGTSIPADPNVKNFSYTIVDGDVYYRENSVMVKPDLNATAKERVKGMVQLRDCVQKLIGQQMDRFISDETIHQTQRIWTLRKLKCASAQRGSIKRISSNSCSSCWSQLSMCAGALMLTTQISAQNGISPARAS